MGLQEAEVEFEIVQPGDPWVDVIFAKVFGQVAVVCSELVGLWGVVVSGDDRIAFDTHVSVKAKEAVFRQVIRVPMAEWLAQSHAELTDTRLSEEGQGHLRVSDVEVHRPASFPAQGFIGVEELLDVPALGVILRQRIDFLSATG